MESKVKFLSILFNRKRLETKIGWVKILNIQYLKILEDDIINVRTIRKT